METKILWAVVGNYRNPQKGIEDCSVCRNALYGTILLKEKIEDDYICLECKLKSLTTNPLDEKEVEKIIFNTLNSPNIDVVLKNSVQIMNEIAKVCSKDICSHFSKPVIKYPEKKEELSRCVPKNDYNWGYNQAIDDMHKLNGEGGV